MPPSDVVKDRKAEALARAVKLFQDFTGLDPTWSQEVSVDVPDVALVMGECDGILYTAIRDDGGVKRQRFIHEFRRKSRPLLCCSSDGKTLVILSGGFQVTERGIEDR